MVNKKFFWNFTSGLALFGSRRKSRDPLLHHRAILDMQIRYPAIWLVESRSRDFFLQSDWLPAL